MAAPTYSQFAIRFAGEAVLSSDATVQTWIANRISFWWEQATIAPSSAQRDEAAMLRAAHERQLVVDRGTSTQAGGTVRRGGRLLVGESVGEYSRQYTSVATTGRNPAEIAMMQSDYGQAYMLLVAGWPKLPRVGGYR